MTEEHRSKYFIHNKQTLISDACSGMKVWKVNFGIGVGITIVGGAKRPGGGTCMDSP